MRNLLLSGGIYHPFAETSLAIADCLEAQGIRSEIVGVAEGLTRLAEEPFDLVTINALAFSMTQAEKYAPLREGFAFEIGPEQQRALEDHVRAGRGLLGLHTASICFDTWPGWGDLLGAQWVWGQSGHPMPDYLTVQHGPTTFTVWDELYQGLRLHPETRVHATARLCAGGGDEPVLTRKERAVYLALGHDMTAVSNPGYAPLLRTAAAMALPAGGS